MRLPAGLRPDPLRKLTALPSPSWIEEGQREMGGARKEGRERREKEEREGAEA